MFKNKTKKTDDNIKTDKKVSENKKKGFSDRKTSHRIISLTITCLVIAAVVIVNAIAMTLTDKYSVLTADITGLQSFELSEESVKVAQNIKKDVKITFLATKSSYEAVDPYCKQTSTVANRLAQNSDGKISVEYIDLVRNPTYENNYPDAELSTTDVIISCGEKYKIVTADDLFDFQTYDSSYSYIASSQAEQVIDSAILTVTSDVTTKIALVTDNCTDDYSYFKSSLTSNNYEITEISLLTDEIPDDTDMVIAYAPTKDYTYDAMVKLEKFLENGKKYGKSLLYVAYRKESDTPNIDTLLEDFGMKVEDGLAFDMDTTRVAGNNYYDGLMCDFASELYTDNISDTDYPVIVSLACPVTITDKEKAQGLLSLSSQSGYCPFDAQEGEWSMEDAVTGDVMVMAQGVVGTDDSKSTLVVAGSTNMFEKSMLGSSFGNAEYIFDMFAVLNNRTDSTIKLENKVISDYDLNISTHTAAVVGVIIYAVIPLIILGAGLIVFFVRRNK